MKKRISAPVVIPCTDREIIKDGYVEYEDGVITAVGAIADLKDRGDIETEHYPGSAIMPGLINSHEHLNTKSAYTSWTMDVIRNEPITAQTIRAVRNAAGMLNDGVTTIRECGCRDRINISLSKASREKWVQAPNIVACGSPISMIGGHCYYYSHEISGPVEAVAAVRTELKFGAHFIKVHATGGAGTKEGSPEWRQLSLEELTAIANEAHANDKRVCSHSIGREGCKNTILAGIDSLEHGHYLDDELLTMMAELGTYYVPTLTGYIPLARHGLELGRPAWMVENAKALLEKHQEVMVKLKKYPEIVVATGSDSTGSVATEIEELNKSGFEPMDVLLFATRNGADVLGILERTGTLESGKEADIIVLDGNPLKDLSVLKQVKHVIKTGDMIR